MKCKIKVDGYYCNQADEGCNKEAINKSHKDFKIVCEKCGCDCVTVDNSLGSSAMSGSWGSVDLVCNHSNCGNSVQLVGS